MAVTRTRESAEKIVNIMYNANPVCEYKEEVDKKYGVPDENKYSLESLLTTLENASTQGMPISISYKGANNEGKIFESTEMAKSFSIDKSINLFSTHLNVNGISVPLLGDNCISGITIGEEQIFANGALPSVGETFTGALEDSVSAIFNAESFIYANEQRMQMKENDIQSLMNPESTTPAPTNDVEQ